MCSGLTAYSALKRLASRAARAPLLLVGMGGVGLMGLALARAMYGTAPYVADIDPKKREAALAAGAGAAFDPADPGARKELLKASGGIYAAVDFVGSDKSLNFASGVMAKGGKIVITGLIGGTYTTGVAMLVAQGHGDRGHADRHIGRSARIARSGAREEYRRPADRRAAIGSGKRHARRFTRRQDCRARGADGVTLYGASLPEFGEQAPRCLDEISPVARRLTRSAARMDAQGRETTGRDRD